MFHVESLDFKLSLRMNSKCTDQWTRMLRLICTFVFRMQHNHDQVYIVIRCKSTALSGARKH